MSNESLKHVIIYTDGAAEPNPGPGGYGVVLLHGDHRKELSAAFETTTNNRMELLAVIAGLEALKTKCRVTLHSDSRYVVDSVNNGSVFRWRKNGWLRTRNTQAKNTDLWERFVSIYEEHEVQLVWVKGHVGIAENERCDQLAANAATSSDRGPDIGYSPSETSTTSPEKTAARKHSSSKTKHKEPDEPCRKCSTPIVKRVPKKKRKANQSYYYEWYLYCPNCHAMYMVEAAKRLLSDNSDDGTLNLNTS